VAFDRIPDVLPEVDIVIASTGAPGYVVTAEMVAAALRRRRNRLLFLIDIAVPRDIDPAAGEIDNVYLYNIDHLQDVVDANRETRLAEAQKAEGIVAEEVAVFEAWFNALAVVPTIVALRGKMEGIVRGELERSATGWGAICKKSGRGSRDWPPPSSTRSSTIRLPVSRRRASRRMSCPMWRLYGDCSNCRRLSFHRRSGSERGGAPWR